MPLVTYIAPFDRFHGKVIKSSRSAGQVTYTSAKSGFVSRAQAFPSNPRTVNQRTVRGFLTTLSRWYQGLTDEQIDAWNAAASTINRSNILDVDYTLSGIGYFQMINFYRTLQAEAPITDPPDPLIPPTPVSVAHIGVLSSALTININTGLDTSATDYKVYVRTTPPVPSYSRKARANQLSMIAAPTLLSQHIGAVTSGVGEVSITMDQLTLEAGDIVGVSAITLSPDGVPSRQLFVPNVEVEDDTP